MAIYMQFDGGSVKGDVTAKGFENWIEVSSLQFGLHRAITMDAGRAANRSHGRPSISDITLSKPHCKASPFLLKASLTGDQGKKAKIVVVETGAKQLKTYVEYDLEDVLVSSYNTATSGDAPQETIALSFTKITTTFTNSGRDNTQGSPVRVTYDVSTAVPA